MNSPLPHLRRAACMVLVRTSRWHRRRELVSQCLPGFLVMDDDDFLPENSEEDWQAMHMLAVPDCLEAAALALSRGQDIAVIGDTATTESALQYLRVASAAGARVAIIESRSDVDSMPLPWGRGWHESLPVVLGCCMPVISESECRGASFGAAIASLATPVDPRLIEAESEDCDATRHAVRRSVDAVADHLRERLPGRAIDADGRYILDSNAIVVPLVLPEMSGVHARLTRSQCGALIGWHLRKIAPDWSRSALAMGGTQAAREAAARQDEKAALVGLSGEERENEKRRQRSERSDRMCRYHEERQEILRDYESLLENSSHAIAFIETGTAGDTADRIVEWVRLVESCSIPEGAERLRAIAAGSRPALIGVPADA